MPHHNPATTKPKPISIRRFKDWLAKQPNHRKVNLDGIQNCVLVQYAQSLSKSKEISASYDTYFADGKHHTFPPRYRSIILRLACDTHLEKTKGVLDSKVTFTMKNVVTWLKVKKAFGIKP